MIEQTLQYGDLSIPYKIFFVPGPRRKLTIHVHPDGWVQVEAPSETSLREIKAAVGRRARWLWTHLERTTRRRSHLLPREYVSGESHYYLGRRYVLKVRVSRHDAPLVRLWRGQFQVVTEKGHAGAVRDLLWDWYRHHARDVFDRRLATLCERLPWTKEPPPWRLVAMKNQWGSCSPRGTLTLNPHLVKAPSKCIDYVLLHELCHLECHNHSPRFYRLLSQHMREWEAVKAGLDDMAEFLINA